MATSPRSPPQLGRGVPLRTVRRVLPRLFDLSELPAGSPVQSPRPGKQVGTFLEVCFGIPGLNRPEVIFIILYHTVMGWRFVQYD